MSKIVRRYVCCGKPTTTAHLPGCENAPTVKPDRCPTRWRKKPIVVEAIQLLEGHPTPEGVNFGVPHPDGEPGYSHYLDGKHWVQTLGGPLVAQYGDWIITGVKGERYPCKPDIFAATYTPDAPPPAPQDEAAERLRRAAHVKPCKCGHYTAVPKEPRLEYHIDRNCVELRAILAEENAALLKRAEEAERIPDACPHCGDTTCDAVPGR